MFELNTALALTMFSIASYYDLRERSVSDYLWIAFGSVGVLQLILTGSADTSTMVSIAASVGIALAAMYSKLYGMADAFAIVVLAIILPTYNGIILPIAVLLGASMLSLLFTCSLNLFLNTRCLIMRGKTFEGFDEPMHRKIIAFFLIHKKIEKERFVFAAEARHSGSRRFRFLSRADDEFVKEDRYVTTAMPLTLFMLIALISIIILQKLRPDILTL